MGDFIQQLTANLVVAALSVFAVSLGFFAINYLHKRRQMLHQERMASLIKGLHYAGVAREVFTRQKPDTRDHLLRGLRWLLGAGGLSGTVYGFNMLQPAADATSALRGALIGILPAAIGLAHLIFSWISSRRKKNVPVVPGVGYRPVARRF